MRTELTKKAQNYFASQLGVPWDALLTPIAPDQPTGKSVRGNGVYSAIKEARREDDPTLPQGAWAYELKRADWRKVSDIAVHAIASKSKDLQLAAWLLEAQINLSGFDGIASCVLLMDELCNAYWQELHPQMEGGDAEYRANILDWANDKLLPAIRQIPVTACGRGQEYHWADWEQAKRNEQIKAAHGNRPDLQLDGPSLNEFATAMAGTPTEAHMALYRKLAEALESIETLTATLDRLWGEDHDKNAPSLNALASLLEQVQALVAAELYKRGVRLSAAAGGDKPEKADDGSGGNAGGGGGSAGGDGGDGGSYDQGPIRDRTDAYARLAAAADFLMRVEPHSPAPYLVKRAVDWGNLNTAELYHEVFVRFGGQLSIFELLGIAQDHSG
ncbi:MAG TPA: type VI secretion system protein TssA [Rhodocyclaceae bacterium]|nr:type VI secretion system protein TssA [Rhodocyclaceae bacterium]